MESIYKQHDKVQQKTADYAWQTETQTGIKFAVDDAREVFPMVGRM